MKIIDRTSLLGNAIIVEQTTTIVLEQTLTIVTANSIVHRLDRYFNSQYLGSISQYQLQTTVSTIIQFFISEVSINTMTKTRIVRFIRPGY